MRALITGGRGFLGAHLAARLLGQGVQVRVLDDGSGASCRPALESVEVHHGSVLDEPLVRRLIRDVDVVFHLAAVVGVQRVLADPLHTYRVNFEGTRVVGEAAADRGVRLLYASSSEVYGQLGNSPGRDNDAANTEDDPPTVPHLPRGRSSYPVSKLAGEEYLQLLAEGRNLSVVITRLFNTVGPGQSPASGMVLPRLVQQALAGQPLTIFGTGSQTRSFADVREVSQALVQLADLATTTPVVVNVGSAREITMAELATLVLSRTRSNSVIERQGYTEAYGGEYRDQLRRRPDLSRLTRLLAWCPDRALPEIIDDVVAASS